jgi:GNAT superfamily N-acetyltransferase
MVRIKDKSKVIPLLMQDELTNLSLLGALREGDPRRQMLYVDDPEHPRAVALFDRLLHFYAANARAARPFIQDLKRRKLLRGGAIPKRFVALLKQGRKVEWENSTYLHYYPGKVVRAKLEHKVRPLLPKHAGLVSRNWQHGKRVEYIRWRIKKGPSAAVYLKGKPVSWALTHGDGSMGIMFTLPEHRSHGYARTITNALTQKVLDRGHKPFLYVSKTNHPSLSLVTSCGFVRRGEHVYIGMRLRKH